MIKVGITGGIGSGKSIVSSIFRIFGVPVYDADNNTKILINNDKNLRRGIIELFGNESFTPEGYNTRYVASQVFDNSYLLEKLNRIVHPTVADDFKNWAARQKGSIYIIEEAAILYESGADKYLDRVIVVDAPIELRINRIIKRNNTSRDNVVKRINNQWPAEKLRELADWVIVNNDKELILPQVLAIHNDILKSI